MAIELKNVSKRFGAVHALDSVTLRFEEGKIYGLLGNNGAGKTTMLNIITNRLYPDSGEVTVDGESVLDNDRALGKIFMMGEQNLYPEDMTVLRALKLTGMFYPDYDLEKALSLAEQFKLPLRKKITSLSTGYTSIFRLVLALSVNTPYLILDEPVLGLDAQHRDMFYRMLMEKCSESPCTVIFSTHLIQEAAGLIEHAVIIKDGVILKNMPAEDLLCGAYTVSGPAGAVDAYAAGRRILSGQVLGGLKTVCLEGEPDRALPAGLELSRVNLQDYFISLMNEEESK